MLYAVCPSPIFNFKSRAIPGHIFITKSKFSFILVPDAPRIFARHLSHYASCYMPHDRALYRNEELSQNKTLRSSDLLNFPFYAAHPAREVLR